MVTTGGGEPPGARAAQPDDADVVITTVVSADDARPADAPAAAPEVADPAGDLVQDLEWAWDDGPTDRPATGGQPMKVAGLEERLTALEAVPAGIEALGRSMRHELERCAGVLFGHDRALGALAARLDALEAPAAPAAPAAEAGMSTEQARAHDEALARILDELGRLGKRLDAVEARVEPLEPLPTVVQALRRAVRASDDLVAGETVAREQALASLAGQQVTEAQARDDAIRRLVVHDLDRVGGVGAAQAKGLADVAERLGAAESRLAPLDSVVDDIAALSRILRRELDAIVSDNQARDQMLRRALQNEIEQLLATSEAREVLAKDMAARLDSLENRSAEAAVASAQALGAAGGRLDALEARIAAADRLSGDVAAMRVTLGKELELLRTGGQAHDQVAGELTRHLSALDGRLARLDPVPGEVQSLRTAMLQEAERTVTSLRAVDERVGQLSWVPGEFQEARKRIMAVTSGLQAGQDRVRQLEGALASTTERLEALRARVAAATPRPVDLDMLGGSPPTH